MVADAKSLWEAINSKVLDGNEESRRCRKKCSKTPVCKFFLLPSNESLDKAYDRSLSPSWNQIALIMRNKPYIDEIDIDDLYNNLRVYEDEMKRSSSSNSASQNLAFLSSKNTSSTNEVSTASGDFGHALSLTTNNQSQLENEDFQQIDEDDLEDWILDGSVAMPICTARLSVSTAKPNVSIVRPVYTAKPNVSTARPVCTAKPNVSTARPVCTAKPNVSTARSVGTARLNVSIARPVYATRPTYPRMDNGNPEILLHDHVVMDSGCSSHMTGNKAYLSDYEDYNGGFVAFGNKLKFNLFSVSQMCDKKNRLQELASPKQTVLVKTS
ncbi:hypothetical protein Tco_1074512 [Tanacetum coccineum]